MKEVVVGLLARLAPWASGSLVTYGVTASHAEAIVGGVLALVITGIEMYQRKTKA